MKLFSVLIIFVSMLTLSACGGGSSGSSSAPSTGSSTFSLSLSSSTQTINEEETAEFTVSYNNASDGVSLSANLETELSGIEHQLLVNGASNTISFSVGELAVDRIVNIVLSATDGQGNQASANITVNTINASIRPKILELKAIKDNIADVYNLQEEADLIEVFITLALLNNNIQSDEAVAFNAQLSGAADSDIQASINALLNRYDLSDAAMAFPLVYAETDIETTLVALYAALSTYSSSVNSIIDNVYSLISPGIIDEIPLGSFYYLESQSSISQFYGNPSLGEWQSDRAFFASYAFLEKIVLPEEQVCQ